MDNISSLQALDKILYIYIYIYMYVYIILISKIIDMLKML